MGLRPLEIFYFFQCGDRLYTYKDGPRTERVKYSSNRDFVCICLVSGLQTLKIFYLSHSYTDAKSHGRFRADNGILFPMSAILHLLIHVTAWCTSIKLVNIHLTPKTYSTWIVWAFIYTERDTIFSNFILLLWTTSTYRIRVMAFISIYCMIIFSAIIYRLISLLIVYV